MISTPGQATGRGHPMADGPLRLAQVFASAVALVAVIRLNVPPYVYRSDLQQEYLAAWALRDGVDIFTPLPELSARYFPVSTTNLPHASPHPPILASISLPLTLLPFPVVAILWLMVNVGLLVVIGRWLGLSTPGSMALVVWPPVAWVLMIGQYELLILALIMLGWRSAAMGRERRSGIYFGLATALKLYPGLLLVPYLVTGRFRVVLTAGLVVAGAQIGNLITVGPEGLARYYIGVLPQVADRYMHLSLNSSPHGALLRLLGGARDVEPLLWAPDLVLPLTLLLSGTALLALMRLTPEASPIALLTALPTVWGYSVVLALPLIAALLRRPGTRVPAVVAACAASFALPLANLALTVLTGHTATAGTPAPPIGGILAAIQPVGQFSLLLLTLMAHSRQETSQASQNKG